MKKYKALDLFSGLGGWSNGLALEGFECLGVEINREIAGMYKHKVIVSDVKILNPSNFKGFDLIVGSPPCREFTQMNDTLWRVKKNPQKGLINVNAFLNFVKIAQPKFWLMENVPGLTKYLDLKPRVVRARIGLTMYRNFWGNFPAFLIPIDLNKKKISTYNWGKYRKWKRAVIPLGVSRALGRTIRQVLESIKKGGIIC